MRDGTPAIAIIRCDKIEALTLVAGDETLWRVRAPKAVDGTEFAIGIEPPGFVTEVAYSRFAGSDDLLEARVEVSGDRYPTLVQFRLRDLRDGEVWFNGESVTYDGFLAADERDCGSDLRRTFASILFLGLVVTAAAIGLILAPLSLVKLWWRR